MTQGPIGGVILVLQYGAEVEVVGPESLREEVSRAAHALVGIYGGAKEKG